MYKLYGRLGSGSGAVEAILRVANIDCDIVDLARWPEGEPPPELLAINPLGQVPTLILPDGGIMTESAAMCVYLADLHPSCGLSPAIGEPSRATFLRWMFYLAANIYMSELRCYYPHRYTADAGTSDAIRQSALERRTFEWAVFADALGERPFVLGDQLSAVDIYAAMLISWVDDLDVFCERFPVLRALYARVAEVPVIAKVWSRHGMPA
ncbi:MAG: glutathione S-transferase family protein [Mesorhizobium sp.]|nr:glutathione S-transferase family protein [Mesorhizobium sp.]MCO5163447.1 glutathione S-transferase family protein [Mesorhizobium sp.]